MKKILFWGTYDNNNYDIRNLINGLREINFNFKEINKNIWFEKDKSKIKKTNLIFKFIKLVYLYPYLLVKFLSEKKHPITVIAYPGWIDLLLLYPFAKIKKSKIYFFIFISLYDTVVIDRQLIKNKFIAKTIYLFEKLTYNLCDRIYVDTEAHKEYISNLFSIKKEKIFVSYQGISNEFLTYKKKVKKKQVLYFGKYIPLHGIKNLISVIKKCPKDLCWIFIGDGPDKKYLDKFIEENKSIKIKTIKWLNTNNLKKIINESKYIMGIFGKSVKSSNVIPLKIYMSLASHSWIITMDSPAIKEINSNNIITVKNTKEIPLVLMDFIKKNPEDLNNLTTYSPTQKAKNFILSIESNLK